jgi:squalene synthase HpnC
LNNQIIPNHLVPAFEACQSLARSHYENFPVASFFIPQSKRLAISALYAFARTADDFADEPQFASQRLTQLKKWELNLKQAQLGHSTHPFLMAFAFVLKHYQIPIQLPLKLIQAFRMDLKKKRYTTWNQLHFYCEHSANPIGQILLHIFDIHDPLLHYYSDFICTGLQFINFWQDTSRDIKNNRIYYPLEEIKRAKVSIPDLLALSFNSQTQLLVKNVANYTTCYFNKGTPLLYLLKGRLHLEIKATYFGGLGILKKIEAMQYNVFQSQPTWKVYEKIALLTRMLFSPNPSLR